MRRSILMRSVRVLLTLRSCRDAFCESISDSAELPEVMGIINLIGIGKEGDGSNGASSVFAKDTLRVIIEGLIMRP